MGLLRLLLKGVLAMVAVLAVIGGIAYVADYGVDAKVTKVERAGGTCTVTVEPKLLPVSHTVTDLDAQTCFVVQEGNAVRYHVRSERTLLFDSDGGPCIYDTKTGVGCGGM